MDGNLPECNGETTSSNYDITPKHKKTGRVIKCIIVNVVNTEYSIIKEVIKKVMSWRLTREPDVPTIKYWDLYWHDIEIAPEMLSKLKPYQKVNHFPGMESLSRKNLLCKNLSKMKKLYPKEYSFFPTTWLLP